MLGARMTIGVAGLVRGPRSSRQHVCVLLPSWSGDRSPHSAYPLFELDKVPDFRLLHLPAPSK